MPMEKRRWISRYNVTLYAGLLIAASFSLTGCQRPDQSSNHDLPAGAERAAAPRPAETRQAEPERANELPLPETGEVQNALARIFQGAVMFEARGDQGFLVGDFNGDGSQDIAIVVKPVRGRLDEINHELANWIIGEPEKVVLPDPHRAIQPFLPPMKISPIKRGDTLMAVIHGYGAAGWRNPEARQTYLLKNAVGRQMSVQPAKELLRPNEATDKLPRIRGDVITGRLAGSSGLLFWSGANYAWHRWNDAGQMAAKRADP